ncbi:PREDICTED: putative methyltransferase DDB_G0268948 [Gekko japonicus]|uniref:Methyltransferase DDB_G0268948 n=1 Tax=Gekko japonicus TaxID=146911 RepID=A0ABM1JPX0_GEKJA|nr:PREDICTED: putative methyltransferase DDB_G0268948 [Gekko japonicus]
MATHLFEGKEHASVYQRYRFSLPEKLQEVISSYLENKKVSSFQLAVDVGCGSGQSTPWLAKRFEKVVGTDISEAQIEEAKQAAHPPNVSYLVCPAENLPFNDNSVDFILSFAAVHWFDIPRFMKEVERVLKPSGCVVLSTNCLDMQLHYKDCTEKLTEIFEEFRKAIFKYANDRVCRVEDDYKMVFDALPFQDKQRITDIFGTVPFTVAGVLGYFQSFSMYQTLLKAEPEAAKSLLQNTKERILEVMGVSSLETPVEIRLRNVAVLGCKTS